MIELDARGLSCPEPVILLKNSLSAQPDAIRMIVDNHASRENVTRFAEYSGYSVTCSEDNGEYTLEMHK